MGEYDASNIRGKVAVAGVYDDVSPTGELDITGRALEARVIKGALDDAGLSISDVDGIFAAGDTMGLAEALKITPRYTDGTSVGGSSFEIHVEHATAAIASGLIEVAIIPFAQTPRAGRRARGAGGPGGRFPMGGVNPMMEWEMPYGLRMPMGAYALAASRHMAQYGTTSEQLAQIAVSTRDWASKNPRAKYQTPITIQDVLESKPIVDPFHQLDCCLVTDGAGCVVLTRADKAKDLKKPPVYVLGVGTAHDHSMISQMPDLTQTAAHISGPKAFKMAGIKPDDVQLRMIYDSFTYTVLVLLEDLGFCEKGEGGAFVEDGKLGPGGTHPTNTNGGGLSFTHPGMYGMFLLVEAVKQVRGEGEARQVPGVDIAIAHGSGGVLSSMSTVVFGSEATL